MPRSRTARARLAIVVGAGVVAAACLAFVDPPPDGAGGAKAGGGAATRESAAERAARVSEEVAKAAAAFLRSLPEELRPRAMLAFESRERTTWHFVPGARAGVAMKEMPDASRAAARALVRSALSSRGMLKVESIMALDNVLREMERAAGGSGAGRDPLAYYVAVYGTPGVGPWGWRVEGHHVSLHFTHAPDGTMAVTPSFLGANPATVPSGAQAGMRVLAAEEDMGRGLYATLTAEQREKALIAKEAPADILSVPGRSLDEVTTSGVGYGELDERQREMVRDLVREFADNLRGELAHAEIERIAKAGWEGVRFAWAGGENPGIPGTPGVLGAPGVGSYYRLSGPTFVIEYDNTQNGANHVHTVWHDRERDFGRDLLKEHLERDHGGR
jgi:hypothetical protein